MIGLIAWFTLRSAPEDAEAAARSAFLCLWPCGVGGLRDAVLNVVMFVPLGFALRTWLGRGVSALLVVAATAGIEGAQALFLYGRDASLRDLLANSLGGCLGILILEHVGALLAPGPAAARRLTGVAAAGWLALVAGTAAGIRPAMPATVYWGQHTAELGQFQVYRGELLESAVNGWPFPNGRVSDSPRLRALLLGNSLVVTATVVSGPAPEGPAPILSIFDENQQQILMLGQDRRGIVYSELTGLAAAELGEQNLFLPEFPGSAEGDTVHLAAGHLGGGFFIRVTAGGVRKELRWPRSAGWLWTGLNPFYRIVPPWAWVVTAGWLGALLLPAGYWLGRAVAAPGGVALLLLPVTLGLGGATRLFGIPAAMPSEWLGSLLGGLLGWLLARWYGRRRAGSADPGGGRPRGSPLH